MSYIAIKTVSKIKKSKGIKESTLNVIDTKFIIQDGITFYYFLRSPCARRVWLTLLEKNIKVNYLMVNLMQGNSSLII